MFLGRLAPNKRPGDALEAWRLARKTLPGLQLWAAGDGPLRNKLAPATAEGVHLFGRVDEAMKWGLLSRARLLLVPSVREGWGIVVMEAASVGTPAIGYRVPGLVDSIKHGETGWLCDPSPASMAASIVDAIRDPARIRVGIQAQMRARTFTWEDTAAVILEHAMTPTKGACLP